MPALKSRSRMPRPDDPEILRSVAESTALGHPIQTAGRLAGLGHTTAWDWNRKGTAEIEANPDSTPEELGALAVFADTVKRAEAQMVDIQLHHIARDAQNKGGWTAAMTLLERRRPKDFGRNVQVENNTTVTYVHELGPGASKAIASHILSTETDTGGSESSPTPMLAEGRSDSTD